MKVAIVYPPIKKNNEYPLLGQNRQFRYSKSLEVRIYPMIPAMAATLVSKEGYGVLFLDGINERLSMEEFMFKLDNFNPDLVVIESKTPIIKKHWEFINNLKYKSVLVGDHVSFFPKESFDNCKVDYILVGGDYDLGILNLVKFLDNKNKLVKGIWSRDKLDNGRLEVIENLDKLPFVDRELTKWKNYGEAYLYHPCTYILTGRGCGGIGDKAGHCSFCVWQHALWDCKARLRDPRNVVKEIKGLVNKYNIKEVFDDNEAGAIWNKQWLEDFYNEMKKEELIGRVKISCNARADSLDEERCSLMRKTGFRLLKVGLESGSNETLNKVNKMESIEDIKRGIKTAKNYKLRVLITSMVGYPWENDEDVRKTYEAMKELMLYKTGFGDSLQSSVIIPYPGTPLHKDSLKKDEVALKDYEDYDQSKAVLKTNIDTQKWCKKIWGIHYHPLFVVKTLFSIRSLDDFNLLFRGFKSMWGHIRDY